MAAARAGAGRGQAGRLLTHEERGTPAEDPVARYCAAAATGDIDALMETLAPDVELASPIFGRMTFRGHDDVRALLTAVYSSLSDLRWSRRVEDGDVCVVLGSARVGGVALTDAMVFELAPDGAIRRVSPHLRPWLALTLFALVLGPKVARRPGIIGRALSRGGAGRTAQSLGEGA